MTDPQEDKLINSKASLIKAAIGAIAAALIGTGIVPPHWAGWIGAFF